MGKTEKPFENRGNSKRLTRREFLRDTGSVVGGLAITSAFLTGACQQPPTTSSTTSQPTSTLPSGVIQSPDTLREDRIPPGQRQVETWPVLQAGGVLQIDPAEWTFTISGLVNNPATLSYSDFLQLPTVQVFSDIHCVTTWSRLSNLWEGPSSQTIVELAKIKPGARFVIVKAPGFSTNLTLTDFMEEDVLFATRHDDQLLTAEHGAPVRLVVPRLYFWKSAKWVIEVEFTAEDRPGFWESGIYHNRGDPWLEQRYG